MRVILNSVGSSKLFLGLLSFIPMSYQPTFAIPVEILILTILFNTNDKYPNNYDVAKSNTSNTKSNGLCRAMKLAMPNGYFLHLVPSTLCVSKSLGKSYNGLLYLHEKLKKSLN